MSLENYQYRTNPLFLRNQFSLCSGKYGIPIIPKPMVTRDEFHELRMIGFDRIKQDQGKHSSRIVHFFLYDNEFEKVWKNPEMFVKQLQQYRAILTPDFSMYTEMPAAVQLFNIFRNRWCGAYFAEKGIRVIPSVNWGTEERFDFCFEGIEKGSAVAVSTYMFHEHGNNADQKEIFMKGYHELLRRIEPEYIICYSEPFSEMKGNIIYVDYDLSSWRHMADDVVMIKHTNTLTDENTNGKIIKRYCYTEKGGGSAYGGEWVPPKGSEWFLGKPNTIVRVQKTTSKGSYDMDVKYNGNGYAERVRHYTDHSYPKAHSNPHDHVVDWENGKPVWGHQINYFDGEIPVFKQYMYQRSGDVMEYVKIEYTPGMYQFKTLNEVKESIIYGGEIYFSYYGKEYGIMRMNKEKIILVERNSDDEKSFSSIDDLLDYELNEAKLREVIMKAEIIDRNM